MTNAGINYNKHDGSEEKENEIPIVREAGQEDTEELKIYQTSYYAWFHFIMINFWIYFVMIFFDWIALNFNV